MGVWGHPLHQNMARRSKTEMKQKEEVQKEKGKSKKEIMKQVKAKTQLVQFPVRKRKMQHRLMRI